MVRQEEEQWGLDCFETSFSRKSHKHSIFLMILWHIQLYDSRPEGLRFLDFSLLTTLLVQIVEYPIHAETSESLFIDEPRAFRGSRHSFREFWQIKPVGRMLSPRPHLRVFQAASWVRGKFSRDVVVQCWQHANAKACGRTSFNIK